MCIMHCRKYHFHDCNRDSHVHNLNKNCYPHICCWNFHLHKCYRNCIIATETVTFITASKRSTNISAAESTTNIIAMEPKNLHNCYRKCQLHSSNRNRHLQNWLQKLSLAEMMTVRDQFSFFKKIKNWDSLHARMNSHYKAWSYKKRSTKRLQHTENLFRKNLQLKDVC